MENCVFNILVVLLMQMLIIHNWQKEREGLHTLSADLDQVTTTYLQSLGEVMPDFISDSFRECSSVCSLYNYKL